MISRRQKMVTLWKWVRFIEIVQPENALVRNLKLDGLYSSDFSSLNEEILDHYGSIEKQHKAVYADTEQHRAVKETIDTMYS